MEIKFIASDKDTELTVDHPIAAKSVLPDWYKNTKRFLNNDGPLFENGLVTNNSLKACYPFYDALVSGYVQKTWCDVHFKFDYNKENKLENFAYNYSRHPKIVGHRDHVAIPIPESFHQVEFTWRMPWMPIMPKGWSVLISFPMNRPDLPFWSPSGIMDSDNFYHSANGNYPFYINKSFNNKIIPAGTPMYQIIPFKREKWKSKIKKMTEEQRAILQSKMKNTFIGEYKKLFYEKKYFE